MGRHISSDIISIHALREEGDTAAVVGTAATCGFLSTPSVRRATIQDFSIVRVVGISIHALREEGDPAVQADRWHQDISIHALREEGDRYALVFSLGAMRFLSTPSVRRATRVDYEMDKVIQFLSTPSVRRATDRLLRGRRRHLISIHALREEGDSSCRGHSSSAGLFLSTPSVRRATEISVVGVASL